MNGNFYQNPTFPTNNMPPINNQNYSHNDNLVTPNIEPPQDLPEFQVSYIENILRSNKGKNVKVYYSYPDSEKWKDVEYNGVIEEAGIDHVIIKDSTSGSWYLLRMIYLNYVEFIEPITYNG